MNGFSSPGPGGCIGAWTVRRLLDAGVEVVATDLSEDLRRFSLVSHPRVDDKLDFVALDVTATKTVA